jgi:hypothetical protein
MGIIAEGMSAQIVVPTVPVAVQRGGCIRVLRFLISSIGGGGAG